MTLTKAHIAESVRHRCSLPKHKATDTVELILEIIKGSLESGDDVLISGFGKFSLKDRRERRGRNPYTGQSMILKPRRVVTFQCSRVLRDRINDRGDI